MYHLFLKCRSAQLFTDFKKYRNKVTGELKQAKIKYYERLFAKIKNDPRKVWNEVRDLTSTKRQNTEINIKTATGVLTGVEAAAALQVWFQEDLALNMHIDKLAMELSRTVGCLYRLSTLVNPWLQCLLYYALFHS